MIDVHCHVLPEIDNGAPMLENAVLELPDGSVPVGADRLVRHLGDNRIRLSIVHPERNKAAMDASARIRLFVERGCYLQLTAAPVTGEFGPAAMRTSEKLLQEGWVTVIASDAHNLRGRAPRTNAARDCFANHYSADLDDELNRQGPARLAGLVIETSVAA